jgi:hypothetical protein
MARGHTFSDPEVKKEMLDLRRKGYSYMEIARKYSVDHTSILYHCQKAGLTLTEEEKIKLFDLVKGGRSSAEVGLRLRVPPTVVEFYCFRYGVGGDKVLFMSKSCLNLPPLNPPSGNPTSTVERMKIDSRGVEWFMDAQGTWLCVGKTERQMRIDKTDEKKRNLEKKRLELLAY